MKDETKLELMKELMKRNVSIKQLIVNVEGDNHFHDGDGHRETRENVTDEDISRAIISINGKEKPLNEKQLFLGVICVLLSKYGWAGNISACCTRINNLPMNELFEKECDYNCIKILTAYKFASVDYKEWETYEPRTNERGIFKKCKAVADAFDEAILMQEE
ncbi:MAG: hypothetical protein IKD75_02360 [Prevotella sp.]|nr:hypothetical protein [Prevotella sp.]